MKMSKSIGNTIVPEKIVQQYGADILRLWVAQTDYTADQRIGDEILKGVADSYRRLRNTMRYMLGSLTDFDEADAVATADMPELERLGPAPLADLDGVVREGYAKFDFQGVFQAVFNFATLICRPSISISARMRCIATATRPADGRAHGAGSSCSTV